MDYMNSTYGLLAVDNSRFLTDKDTRKQQVQKNNRIKRILLVDDENDVNFVIKLVLETNGLKVDSFTNAFEVLEICSRSIRPCHTWCYITDNGWVWII